MDQTLRQRVAQVRAQERLQHVPGERSSPEPFDAEIVESLRISLPSVTAVMLPMLSLEAVEIDAGHSAQAESNPMIESRAPKQRAVRAVVHHDRDSVEQQADR